jgi:hypothetical protein
MSSHKQKETIRVCAKCDRDLLRSDFSNTQWAKRKPLSRCNACVHAAATTPTPAPTPAEDSKNTSMSSTNQGMLGCSSSDSMVDNFVFMLTLFQQFIPLYSGTPKEQSGLPNFKANLSHRVNELKRLGDSKNLEHYLAGTFADSFVSLAIAADQSVLLLVREMDETTTDEVEKNFLKTCYKSIDLYEEVKLDKLFICVSRIRQMQGRTFDSSPFGYDRVADGKLAKQSWILAFNKLRNRFAHHNFHLELDDFKEMQRVLVDEQRILAGGVLAGGVLAGDVGAKDYEKIYYDFFNLIVKKLKGMAAQQSL